MDEMLAEYQINGEEAVDELLRERYGTDLSTFLADEMESHKQHKVFQRKMSFTPDANRTTMMGLPGMAASGGPPSMMGAGASGIPGMGGMAPRESMFIAAAAVDAKSNLRSAPVQQQPPARKTSTVSSSLQRQWKNRTSVNLAAATSNIAAVAKRVSPPKKASVVSKSLARKWKNKGGNDQSATDSNDLVECSKCPGYALDMSASIYGACKFCGAQKSDHNKLSQAGASGINGAVKLNNVRKQSQTNFSAPPPPPPSFARSSPVPEMSSRSPKNSSQRQASLAPAAPGSSFTQSHLVPAAPSLPPTKSTIEGDAATCPGYALDISAVKFGACKNCGCTKPEHSTKTSGVASTTLARKWSKMGH